MKNVAIITGASSGLGEEFTKQISLKNDYDEIWIIARRKENLDALRDKINQSKNFKLVRSVPMDISGQKGVESFKNFLQKEDQALRKIESGIEIKLLINNAGFGTYGPFAETSPVREMDLIDLNCTALTGITGVCLPFMKKDSVIINTASLAAYLPLGNFAVYAASKAYVLNFSLALAAELKERGIKVCALCPGSVSTEFANVASNGARKEVKGGFPPQKVVTQCIKRAFKGRRVSLYRTKWKLSAFLSRFISGYAGARFTYKFNKRPHNPDKDMQTQDVGDLFL